MASLSYLESVWCYDPSCSQPIANCRQESHAISWKCQREIDLSVFRILMAPSSKSPVISPDNSCTYSTVLETGWRSEWHHTTASKLSRISLYVRKYHWAWSKRITWSMILKAIGKFFFNKKISLNHSVSVGLHTKIIHQVDQSSINARTCSEAGLKWNTRSCFFQEHLHLRSNHSL